MEILREFTLLPLIATIATYQFGLFLQKKTKSPLCNPLLISIALLIGLMLLTGYPNADYQAGMKTISWLITPATICLAVPLYQQVQILKKHWKAMLAGIVAGTFASLSFILVMCQLLGVGDVLTFSLLPKSITTAMGTALSEQTGGDPAITTAAIAITGILGCVLCTPLCKLFRITHPVAQGVALGTAAHVLGTTKARELSDLTGAVSSLSLTVAGILTAILYPIITIL
ncbi:MAG: LrgB family protein [Ruminococcaceae bacterium]|nr:LrgB family protein [Oscillospiraceae bacterium]